MSSALIQIRLTAPSFEKISPASQGNSSHARVADSSSRNAVNFLISAHNETLSVVTMDVSNEDRSAVTIHGCDAASTPSGFAEIISDGFPVLHSMTSRRIVLATLVPSANVDR
jgi:hypothetical protein